MQSGNIADGNDESRISDPNQQLTVFKSMLELESMFDFSLYGSSPDGQPTTLQPIRTVKLVMAAGSKYFRGLFTNNNFKDSQTSDHISKTFGHECLKSMVEFLHKGDIQAKNTRFAIDLLNAARYYGMDALVSACEIFLVNQLKVDNGIDLWKCACQHDWSLTFFAEIEKFLAKNLSKIMIERSFLALSLEQICKLLLVKPVVTSASNDICLQAALAWLECDPEKRRFNSDVVLKSITLNPGTISRKALISACRSKAMSQSMKQQLLDLWTCYLDLDVSEFISVPDYVEPSLGVPTSSSIAELYFVGGQQKECCKQFLQYNVDRKEWVHLEPLPWSRFGGSAGVFDGGRLLVFGGKKDDVFTADVDEFNLSSTTWSKVSALPNECIWSACSDQQNAYLKFRGSLISYSAPTKTIVKKKDIPCKRDWQSATFSANLNAMFVADGVSGDAPNFTFYPRIDKYDVASDTWQSVGFAKIKCTNRAAALGGDQLYLIGGLDRTKDLAISNVEVCNVRTGKVWSVPNLPQARYACKAALLYNNVICVFGSHCTKDVAAYDMREGKWTTGVVVPEMPVKIMYFGFAWK